MRTRRSAKKIRWGQRATIISGLLLMSTSFQNCSDVEFNQLSSQTALSCASGEVPSQNGECITAELRTTVTIVDAPVSQVDLLIVIDNSDSMAMDNRALSQKLSGFVSLLEHTGLDWQACYTTTDMGSTGARGRALTWKAADGSNTSQIVLRKDASVSSSSIDQRFQKSIGQFAGGGSGDEQGVRALSAAISLTGNASCFRNNAVLTTIVISDEDEYSCGGRSNVPDETPLRRSPADYRTQCHALQDVNKPEKLIESVATRFGADKLFLAHSLVIREGDAACWNAQDVDARAFYGMQYGRLSELTGGILGNICSNDYALELQDMADRIGDSLSAMALDCAPYDQLATVTYRATTGASVPASQQHQVQGNKIIFNPALPAGTEVTARYACLVN